jgi:NitT/TauT family transport system substrate-binding protein
MAAISRGAKIKVVGMIFDKTPANIFSRKDKPITKPQDLEGRTVGAPPGDSQRQMWPAFAKVNKIDQSKVTWVNIEPTAKVVALAEKSVDAVADATTGLPLYEKPLGAGAVVMMPWSNFGFDMYSMAIIASEKTMTERPQVLKAFLDAAYTGWHDVMLDPKAAMAIFKKHVPEIDATAIQANMLSGLDLMRTQRYADHGIGWIDEQKMCGTVDLVNTYMGLPHKVECKSVFTNDFLTKVALPVPVK